MEEEEEDEVEEDHNIEEEEREVTLEAALDIVVVVVAVVIGGVDGFLSRVDTFFIQDAEEEQGGGIIHPDTPRNTGLER